MKVMNITSLAISSSVLLPFVFGQLFPVVRAEMFCVFVLVQLPFSKMLYKALGTLAIGFFCLPHSALGILERLLSSFVTGCLGRTPLYQLVLGNCF